MRILLLTTPIEDYLQDQILIGLRAIAGDKAVDFPKKDVLYENCQIPKNKLYGRGFSIWKTLDDQRIDRNHIEERAMAGEFDVVLFGNIWAQREEYLRWKNLGLFRKQGLSHGVLDGSDHRRVFLPALLTSAYFKREQRAFPRWPGVCPISFSMPEGKIRGVAEPKRKRFALHVQCEEAFLLADVRQECQRSYCFSDEEEYYHDIAISRYGITMKKAGWDCMRHYEIAAQHTVPCFYRLNAKPSHCAPHGLIDMKNVVAFDTARELEEKLAWIDASGRYDAFQAEAMSWVRQHSCSKVASHLLERLEGTRGPNHVI